MTLSFSSRYDRTFSFSSYSAPLSSFSSPSSYFESSIDPISPLQSFGVPFSWEHRPGIRRKSHFPSKHNDPRVDLLPLPPAALSNPTREFKKQRYNSIGRDPFVLALVKCSKKDNSIDDYWKAAKAPRAVNDVVGLVDRYTSCKTACSVVDSQVFIPRSRVYNFPNQRSRFG